MKSKTSYTCFYMWHVSPCARKWQRGHCRNNHQRRVINTSNTQTQTQTHTHKHIHTHTHTQYVWLSFQACDPLTPRQTTVATIAVSPPNPSPPLSPLQIQRSRLSFKPCKIFISTEKGKLLIRMKQDPAAFVVAPYLLPPLFSPFLPRAWSLFCGSHE